MFGIGLFAFSVIPQLTPVCTPSPGMKGLSLNLNVSLIMASLEQNMPQLKTGTKFPLK